MIKQAIQNRFILAKGKCHSFFKKTPVLAIAFMVSAEFCGSLIAGHTWAAESNRLQDSRPQQESAGNRREDGSKSSRAPVDSGSTSSIFVASQDEYYIGLTDVLDVRIEDAPELSATYTVSASGTIEIHPFNKKLMALGKTPEQLAGEIRELLIQEDYLRKPIVNVDVKEYNSRVYYITGSVRKPGFYTIKGKVTMLKLLTLAGGLTEEHGAKAFIIRKKTPKELEQEATNGQQSPSVNGEQASPVDSPAKSSSAPKLDDAAETAKNNKVIETPINGLDKGILALDIPLEPHDQINIPPLGSFLIGGEVTAPGPYPLKEGTTLKQALTLARGLTPNAAPQKAVIFRGNIIDGRQEEVKVDANAIMSGKNADVVLQANDLIVVPSSKWKSFRNTVLKTMGLQTISRAIYY